jgi:hypothetical protein
MPSSVREAGRSAPSGGGAGSARDASSRGWRGAPADGSGVSTSASLTPSDGRRCFFQRFPHAHARQNLIGGAGVAVFHNILQANFQRIDAQGFGDFVHQRFDGEAGLRPGRRAHRAKVHFVGVDGHAFQVEVSDSVRPRHHQQRH